MNIILTMTLKKTLTSFLFLCSTFLFSQNHHDFLYGVSLGYMNQSGNYGKIGAFGEIEFGNSRMNMLKLDVNANITGMRNKLSIIPEAGLTFYTFPDRLGGLGIFAETEFTPYTFTPKAGLSLFTFIDFGFGYGFEMHQKSNFKSIEGFQFSFGINIPLNFQLKMM